MMSTAWIFKMNSLRPLGRRLSCVLYSTENHMSTKLLWPDIKSRHIILRSVHSTSYLCIHRSQVNRKRGGFMSTHPVVDSGALLRDMDFANQEITTGGEVEGTAGQGAVSPWEKKVDLPGTLLQEAGVTKPKIPPDEDSSVAIEMYKAIRKMDPGTLLHTILTEHESLNRIHYALAMKRLYKQTFKMEGDKYSKYITDVLGHPGFQVLTGLLSLNSQYYKPEVCADMLVFLRSFGLDSDNLVMQVYLHLAKFYINDITLDRIVMTAIAVNSMTETEDTMLILEGLKVLVPLRANTNNIPTLNVFELVHLFNMYITELNEEQRDCVLECLMEFEESGRLTTKYSILLLDGARKAAEELNIEDGDFTELCAEKSLLFLKNNKLNVEEIKACVDACSELDIVDRKFCNELVNQATELSTRLTTREKLSILFLLRKAHHCDMDLIRQFLPEVLRHVESMPPNEQANFLQICSDIDWTLWDNTQMCKTVLETCRRVFELLQDDDLKKSTRCDMFVMETLLQEQASLQDTESAVAQLEERLQIQDEDARNFLRSVLSSAIDRNQWSKEIHVDFSTEQGLSMDFLLNENPQPEGKESRRLALLSVHRPYHRNTGLLKGPMKCKKILLENAGYSVCLVYHHILRNEGEHAGPFLKRLIHDTLEDSVILNCS